MRACAIMHKTWGSYYTWAFLSLSHRPQFPNSPGGWGNDSSSCFVQFSFLLSNMRPFLPLEPALIKPNLVEPHVACWTCGVIDNWNLHIIHPERTWLNFTDSVALKASISQNGIIMAKLHRLCWRDDLHFSGRIWGELGYFCPTQHIGSWPQLLSHYLKHQG